MRTARLVQIMLLLALSLGVPERFVAQVPTDNALTNADITKMTKAGIPESIILREIQMSRPGFSTSPAALIELKKHGVSDNILGAVLDSRSGSGNSAAESKQLPYVPMHSATPGQHHLPTFEADLQLDSKTHSKLSVGKNHISLEQAGVPLFSLKWKQQHLVK
jgi:hypothetical protein